MADDKELKEISVPHVTLEDSDKACYDWINSSLDIHVTTNKGFSKVPVRWVAGEKTYQAKFDPSLRDASGALILPMITVERTSVVRDPGRKGTAFAHLPNRSDKKGGALTVARRIKQDKTSNFANADSLRRTGKLNFRTRKEDRTVYETISIPMPVYVEATYKVSLKSEYQQQMNNMVQPFITIPGGSNFFSITSGEIRFEAFVQSDFALSNTVNDMQGERNYETTLDIKVIVPLIGASENQESPKYVVRENAVDVKVVREESILDPSKVPQRSS